MSHRPKTILRKIIKQERESRLHTVKSVSIADDDYQSLPTCRLLPPTSKWFIVRHNIHRIRYWGVMQRMSVVEKPFRDWYLFFQMRRELKRAEEEIRAIQYKPGFAPIHHFELPIDEAHVRRYNVSHVQATDGLYYAGLGSEPIVLQYLLYYFSKECTVPYDSLFYSFLSDVNSVLYTNRQRIHRVEVFRRLALLIALAVSVVIFIMFFSLILSVITTVSKLSQMEHAYANRS